MAYEQSFFPTASQVAVTPARPRFDKIVALRLAGEWVGVESAAEAIHILTDAWPVPDGPSHRRALAACEAFIEEGSSVLAARAAFVVAVMEAGLRFELFDDRFALLDFQLAAATEQDVRGSN